MPLEDYVTGCLRSCQKLAAAGVNCTLRLWNSGMPQALNPEIERILGELTGQNTAHLPEDMLHNRRLAPRIYIQKDEHFYWPGDENNDCPDDTQYCYGLRRQLGVLCDGTVIPCCLDSEGRLALGNIFHQSLDYILHPPRAQRIRRGDQKALDKLTRANLRFVVSVAKQYQNQGLSLPDLINEGNLGLIRAAQKFDETRGFKFISYAVWWIRQSILQALAEQSRIVRLPLNQVGSLNKINKELSRFEQENERRPSAEELADRLDLAADKVADTLKVSGRHISVDAPFVDGEDNSLLDVLVNDDSPMADTRLNQESLAKEVNRALQQLGDRERDILKMFFGLGCQEMPLEEIGAKFDLTRERVRQIKEKAIRRLKGQKSRLLKSYLGE